MCKLCYGGLPVVINDVPHVLIDDQLAALMLRVEAKDIQQVVTQEKLYLLSHDQKTWTQIEIQDIRNRVVQSLERLLHEKQLLQSLQV